MRGHQPLVAMRQAGAVPRSVWFSFDGDWWRSWPAAIGTAWKRFPEGAGSAEVLIEPGDSIPRLDLRFAVGLRCWVQGNDAQRVHQLHQALQDAGADRVLSVVMQPDAKGVERTVEMLDTAGILVG